MHPKYRLTRRGALALLCLAVMLLGGILLAIQYAQDREIARQNEAYRQLRHIAAQATADVPTPVPTPNGDTLRITLPTEPPRDGSYAMLSAINPDFCGWLRAGSIDLPVVHRAYDNERYLNTNLSGEESIGGTLFVDGYNRLHPADMLTIIYGHNMHSGDMFGSLSNFLDPAYMAQNAVVHFDTVYTPGAYIPFAVFAAPADEIDIRQLQMDVDAFNALADLCIARSDIDCGIDVRYGDRLLALVTCDGRDDERLFLLCRALRSNESALDAVMMLEHLDTEKTHEEP